MSKAQEIHNCRFLFEIKKYKPLNELKVGDKFYQEYDDRYGTIVKTGNQPPLVKYDDKKEPIYVEDCNNVEILK